MSAVTADLLFPAILVFVAITGWVSLPQRVQCDAASGEITHAQAQRYRRIYRAWCVAFALGGAIFAAVTLFGI